MKLLVDLQALQNTSRERGIGRYMRGLSRGLLRNCAPGDVHFVLSDLFPDHIDDIIDSFAGLAEPHQFHVFSGAGPTAALDDFNLWRSAASQMLYEKFIADLDPDVFLLGSLFEGGGDNTVVGFGKDNRRYLAAMILYDLIPLINPDEHIGSVGARRWYYGKVDEARKADLLLGISASSCREAIEHLPEIGGRVHEIGAGTDPSFLGIDKAQLKHSPLAYEVLEYNGINRPFIMHTSALDARKNFDGLIEAFALLPDEVRRSHQLVLVCKLNPAGHARLHEVIAKCGLSDDDVILTGFVPDDELRILYANCALFVFPSYHEGFGLPVIEAMLCGAPAIGSCLSSVPEVIGLEEAQFDPHNRKEMAQLIARGLCDTDFRAKLLDHAENHVKKFTWDAVAHRALAAIEARLPIGFSQKKPAARTMEAMIDEIAKIPSWPGPSDFDLMAVAGAIARNEERTWLAAQDEFIVLDNSQQSQYFKSLYNI